MLIESQNKTWRLIVGILAVNHLFNRCTDQLVMQIIVREMLVVPGTSRLLILRCSYLTGVVNNPWAYLQCCL